MEIASDWAMVPESCSIGLDQMKDDEKKHAVPDPKDLDVHVKVGWVKGLNRLYFLYEAYDNFWDFADPGLHNDTFEVVVDGDRSGGPLIPQFRNNADQEEYDAHFSMHGVQAQNYHIMTPSEGKDWATGTAVASHGTRSCHGRIMRQTPTRSSMERAWKYTLEFYITPLRLRRVRGARSGLWSRSFMRTR